MDNGSILENIGDGLVVTDKNGKITFINHIALDLLKLDKDNVFNRLLTELVPIEDENQHTLIVQDHPMTQVLTSGKKISGVYFYQRQDNTKFPASVTITPLMSGDDIVGSIHIFRDVTKDEERDRMKDESISMIAHGLRSPMAAVKGLVSMIINGDYGVVSESLKQPLRNIYLSSEKQIHLINNLLTISRLQSGKVRFTLSSFSLSQTIKDIVASHQTEVQQKGITLTVEDVQETLAYADSIWAKEILNNLIDNAIRYTSAGGVTISYRLEEGRVLVVISDTGVGIAPSDQDKVFAAFRHPEGTSLGKLGMGLFIAREIAREMGGDVRIEKSEPGKGSVFICVLPTKVDLEK